MASKKNKTPLQPVEDNTKEPAAKNVAQADAANTGEDTADAKNNIEISKKVVAKKVSLKKINTKKQQTDAALNPSPAADNMPALPSKEILTHTTLAALPEAENPAAHQPVKEQENTPAGSAAPAPKPETEKAKPVQKAKAAKAKVGVTPANKVPSEPAQAASETTTVEQPDVQTATNAAEKSVDKTLPSAKEDSATAEKIEAAVAAGKPQDEPINKEAIPETPGEQQVIIAAEEQDNAQPIPTVKAGALNASEDSINEKNYLVAPTLPAIPALKKQPVQTIRFFLRFVSKPGQNLFITAMHPAFGNGKPDQALPMEFLNKETWTATLPVNADFAKDRIEYNYLLQEPDGSFIYDAGKDKTIEISNYTSAEVAIVDSWNVTGYFENAFYTEPFKEVLLKNNYTKTEYATPAAYTHTFKVKAPLLTQGQVVYISGNIEALSNWEADKSLLLHKKQDEDFWTIDVNLAAAQFAFDYKYGVYDVRADKVVAIENGENRTLYDTLSPSKKTIVNDGFVRLPNNTWKGAGIAIPVFSLRSENSFGAGEFADIKTLVDWAKQVGLKLIQLLPVNDTTATKTWQDSYPYAAISAFALHAMYLNLKEVVNEENKHFLQQYETEGKQLNELATVDYEKVNDLKWKVIHHIYPLQKEAIFSDPDYRQFFENNQYWLKPYAAFCYLRDKNNTADYTRWHDYKKYDKEAISGLLESSEAKDIAGMYYFVQYYLHLQLKEATEYAHANGIIVKGDIAIGVSRNGADTWQQPELFNLDMQAGAPPDDFAVKGQNWGFPTYNWKKMQEDGFAWWKQRFEQMSRYFDAFRIDHILGFFRIWSIPVNAIQGILGRFVPALPVHINEFQQRGINFDYNRYTKPFINDQVLNDVFGDQQWWVKDNLLTANGYGAYVLKDEISTQTRIETYFAIRENNAHNQWLKACLYDLISNVILFEEKGSNGQQFHFRFGIEETTSYKQLDAHTQWQLRQLAVNYFYERQNDFWYKEAVNKLPALKQATNMLICGEDLGMVPASVPQLMSELGLLSLEVQRMPKDHRVQFAQIAGAPYLSVVTPSTHDMSTIRGWWEEDSTTTQLFYNNELGQQGTAPQYCEPWINKMIINQHLHAPAMWSIFQLQDLLGSAGSLRRSNPQEERINNPANPKYYWQYRMHLTLQELLKTESFTKELKEDISTSGR